MVEMVSLTRIAQLGYPTGSNEGDAGAITNSTSPNS